MNAHISAKNKISKKQYNTLKAVTKDYVQQQMQQETENVTRRMTKIMCIALNEQYGFGQLRLNRLLYRVNQLVTQDDPIFWRHADKRMQQLGLDMPAEDYDKLED